MIILSGPNTGLGQITPNTQSSGQSQTVILPRTLVQNFPDRIVEIYHGYVP
jgi:hypothetical protein